MEEIRKNDLSAVFLPVQSIYTARKRALSRRPTARAQAGGTSPHCLSQVLLFQRLPVGETARNVNRAAEGSYCSPVTFAYGTLEMMSR